MRKKLGIMDVYYQTINGKMLHRLSPHTLRHYFLWKVYSTSGNCIITARDIIGHVKAETTARYCSSMSAAIKEREIVEHAFDATIAVSPTAH